MNNVITTTCDLAARRVSSRPRRKAVYWWCDAVDTARKTCIRLRRLWLRAKRKNTVGVMRLQRQYKLARNNLRREIKIAKARAWDDLIASIENDPWGLPYKLVMGRLRPSTPGPAAAMLSGLLQRLLTSLFPDGDDGFSPGRWSSFVWNEDDAITLDEVISAIRNARRSGGDPAPGPGVRWCDGAMVFPFLYGVKCRA